MDERSLRLQARLRVIQKAVEATSTRDIAYATLAVAWLEAIEYYCLQALRKVERTNRQQEWPSEATEAVVAEQHREIKALLQSFHSDLCEHLKLDQADIIERSSAFKEVVHDICNEGG